MAEADIIGPGGAIRPPTTPAAPPPPLPIDPADLARLSATYTRLIRGGEKLDIIMETMMLCIDVVGTLQKAGLIRAKHQDLPLAFQKTYTEIASKLMPQVGFAKNMTGDEAAKALAAANQRIAAQRETASGYGSMWNDVAKGGTTETEATSQSMKGFIDQSNNMTQTLNACAAAIKDAK